MLTSNNRSKIHAVLDRFFSEDDLKTVCFELGVDFDNLSSDNKSGKARELIQWCERSERLPELLAAIVRVRPNAQDDLAFLAELLSRPSPPINPPPIQPVAPPTPASTRRATWMWLAGGALVGLIGIAALVRFVVSGTGAAPVSTSPALIPTLILMPSATPLTPTPALAPATSTAVLPTRAPSSDAVQIEADLAATNIKLSSTDEAIEIVRGFLTEDKRFALFAENCLKTLEGRRLSKPILLDVINGWYRKIKTGSSAGYTTDVSDLAVIAQAMLNTWQETYGVLPQSLAEITETMPARELLVDDFENSDPVSSVLTVATDGVNTGEVSYAGPPHVGSGNQAIQFEIDFRNTNANPAENYISVVRNLTQPGQDWSGYNQFCAWIEASENTAYISFDVGNEHPRVHDKLVELKPGQNEYCVSLRPTLNNTDLTQINFYQFALSGGTEPKKVTVYIDHVYLKP